MLHTMWSPKGGVGLSVTAAATAGAYAKRNGSAVLVDLCGDQPALLGMAEPASPGVFDWLASDGASTESLNHLLVDGPSGVEVLPAGTALEWAPDRVVDLIDGLNRMGREVVIDAGSVVASTASPDGADHHGADHHGAGSHRADSRCDTGAKRSSLVDSLLKSGRSVLVISSCYLALKRAIRISQRSDGVVVVADPGRALTGRDISELLGVPLLAQIERDPALARTVDAGMFLRRPSRTLDSALRNVAVEA